MNMPEKMDNKTGYQWLPKIAIIFFINLALIAAAYFGFEYSYNNRIYPGVFVGNIDLGGKTGPEAKALIDAKISKITGEGVIFTYENLQTTIYPITESSFEGELAHELISFDSGTTVENAINYGRSGHIFSDLKNKISNLLFRHRIPLSVELDERGIKQEIKKSFGSSEIAAKDASLAYHIGPNKKLPQGKFEISSEELGIGINYDGAVESLKKEMVSLNNYSITLYPAKLYPQIYERDCINIDRKANAILEAVPITLFYQDKKWTIEKQDLAGCLKLEINPYYAENKNLDKVLVVLDRQKLGAYIKDKISPDVDKKPNDARFQIINGRLAKFQTPSDGQELDVEATVASIDDQIFHGDQKNVELTVKKIPSDISMDEVNNLGINEIIGTGESNFAGSPKNRRHNIKVGAAAVNGALIKPGEEFSLLKTLKANGDIGSSTGYLPELVIKGDKTTPEYGGGLCQIGTTVFRGAIASGLPITMRRNHSYRVGYYEPAGTDATIYDPSPDLRFVNDTANHILIQSRIIGDKLFFDFWGTKDGRKVEQTKSTIYNIVKPPSTKIIETTDLEAGEKKCTEKAHNGADAYFDYKVTYQGGEIKEKRFSSHYVPWQEVCLLGVKELSASSTPSVATTTPAQ